MKLIENCIHMHREKMKGSMVKKCCVQKTSREVEKVLPSKGKRTRTQVHDLLTRHAQTETWEEYSQVYVNTMETSLFCYFSHLNM